MIIFLVAETDWIITFIVSGLVKELDSHKFENANKYLSSHATYILVRKEINSMDTLSVDSGHNTGHNFNYISLLDNPGDIFPEYKLHVDSIIPVKTSRKNARKSPSPAGRFSSSKSVKKGSESTTTKKASKKRT